MKDLKEEMFTRHANILEMASGLVYSLIQFAYYTLCFLFLFFFWVQVTNYKLILTQT